MTGSIIFTETLKAIRLGTRRIVHQGGQWSGKTVNVLGALATEASEDEEGGVTTVTSHSFPHLKGGALRDFENHVAPSFKNSIKSYHKTDHLYTFRSGHQIEFKVFESEMDARGPKRKRLFINEANKFDYLKYFHLDGRSDITIIDYNPSVKFWSHEKVIGEPGTKLFISDHRHNPFLKPFRHAEIENFCVFNLEGQAIVAKNGIPPKEMVVSGDYELWKVYARGLTGNVMGIIFPNWQMVDESEFPINDGSAVWSIDFGYTNDPTCLIKQQLVGSKNLFVKELAYETGLPPLKIKQILVANGFRLEEDILWCDHDPDMIRDLRNHGIYYAQNARKGQGSINAGIELLKRYNVYYTNTSRNIHSDIGKYIWVQDEKTGKFTNIPIDQFNHAFDAIRYGAYSVYLIAA